MIVPAEQAIPVHVWLRLFFLAVAIVSGCTLSPAQTEPPNKDTTTTVTEIVEIPKAVSGEDKSGSGPDTASPPETAIAPPVPERSKTEEVDAKLPASDPPDSPADDEAEGQLNGVPEKFHWKPALVQSGILLGIQHGFRLMQPKTQRELGGPFFRDWTRSLKNLRGWNDGDNWFINYVAHSMQGSANGRIFVNNSDNARKQEFGRSKAYWMSRGKALAWSAAWSTQFELGPVSEASIGNVGMRDDYGPSKLTWGDLIVTPVFGTAFLVGEDAIDKYILKNWLERKANGRLTNRIKLFRSILTPTTSFANLLRGKPPWKRDNRR